MDKIELAQKIFGGIVCHPQATPEIKEEAKSALTWLYKRLNINVFQNEYAVLFDVIKKYNTVVLPEDALINILESNREKFSSTSLINLKLYEIENGTDENTLDSFIESVMNVYESLVSEETTYEEVKLYTNMYIEQYLVDTYGVVLQNTANILVNGTVDKHKKLVKGFDPAVKYQQEIVPKLQGLMLNSDLSGSGLKIIDKSYYQEMMESATRARRITDFGIAQMDELYGGIYSDFVGFLAPMKGAKTRFCVHVTHRAAVINKKRVLVWVLENKHNQWSNLIRSRHFDWLYNYKNRENQLYLNIDADHIRKNEYTNAMYKSMEYNSFLDLSTNEEYCGNIAYVDEPFIPETALETLERYYDAWPFDLLVIDYLQYSQDMKGKNRTQTLTYLYQQINTRFIKPREIGGLFPGQLKGVAIEALDTNEDIAGMSLRVAGGESIELTRTPDINFLLYANDDDFATNRMQVVPLPSRNNKISKPFYISTALGVCRFETMAEK